MIVTDILLDGLFAAVAAIGFGAISDPPMRAFPRIALLAAIGHALRFTLIHCAALDIATASLFAAFAIGMGSLWLGRGVRSGDAYAVAVEPVAIPQSSLEANVPDNFNLVSVVGPSIGELKFYGQGAGSLPTGNAIVQDLIDCADGVRPTYDFSQGLAYDPSLLVSDYLLRTTADAPDGATEMAPGMWRMADMTAEAARAELARALETDPRAFLAALPKED